MAILQNIKRERQVFAYEKVDKVGNDFKKYKSLIEKTGMMLYTNGLISTLAFLKAGGGEKKEWYDHLSDWFKQQSVVPFTLADNDDLLDKVLKINDGRTLMLLTKEALILSDAFKEMVKAKKTDNND
jgi:CRISPR type III-B/RAMP module-associated protein Cmr5